MLKCTVDDRKAILGMRWLRDVAPTCRDKAGNAPRHTLLEKIWRISLYVTDVAIAKLLVT